MRALFVLAVAAVLTFGATAQAKVLITVNKSTQRMIVAVDGEPLYNWDVSTGRAGRDTPSGDYRAFRMEKDHYSKEWDDAPMPHSIFFTRVGHAIHGSYETKKIGSPASAGCVRLEPENAEILFALVEEQGVLNTAVKVVGDLHVALARHPSRSAGTPEPARPRYGEAPPRHYAWPREWTRSAPPPPYYALPPEYHRQPYPGYYRW